MARQEIILGTPPQGLGGDPPRTASMKINAMTTELYAATGGLVKVASPTDITPGRLVTPGWMGLGTTEAPAIADCNLARRGGKYKGYGLLNAPLQGIVTLDVTGYTDDWISQTLRDVSDKPRVFERSWYGGTTFSPWVEVFTSGNALTDPASGGLMSVTTVSGWAVFKFANGQMCITGGAPTSPSVAANAISFWDVTIPNILNANYAAPITVSASPTVGWDYSGACATLVTANTVRIQIRNGASAQTFNSQLCIWGRWK